MKKLLYLVLFLFIIVSAAKSQVLVESQFSAAIGSGARAMGMGGAFIAVADDATATTWNPGGLGQIEYVEISLVGSYYTFNRYEPSQLIDNNQIGTIMREGNSFSSDFIGISIPFRPFKESDFKVVLQYSYQRLINVNLNSNTNPINFRNIAVNELGHSIKEEGFKYENEEFTGGLDAHSVSLGMKLTSWLNIGMTANWWTNGWDGSIFRESAFHAINTVTNESVAHHEFSVMEDHSRFKGTSFNLGALIHLTDNLNLGFVYKNNFTFSVRDQEGNIKYKVDYPKSLGFGIAYRPIDNLTLTGDFTQTDWSTGRAYNDNMQVYFPMTGLPYAEPDLNQEEFINMFQHDTRQWRFGAEYVIITEDILIPIRAGIYWDRQYFADALNQIPVYTGFTGGIGIVWKSFVLDVAAVYVIGEYQSTWTSTGKTDYSYVKGIASLIYRF